jgi:DNA-directed RNA polymerase subunit beta'
MSAHGARKGLSDTALRTADSGYLTRRLVDVSQELIIRERDCCEGVDELPGMYVRAFKDGKETIEQLKDRILGRYACEDIKNAAGEVLVKRNHMINPRRAERVLAEGVDSKGVLFTAEDEEGKLLSEGVKIRTILTCRCHNGICAKCYGANMATGEAVQVGEAVGIIAAQSIGEPGTQLTMRTFHTGGVAGDDITQGLPRVEELFEARKPKGLAIISEIAGKAVLKDTKKKKEVVVTNEETGEIKTYLIPYGSRTKITENPEGQMIEAGDELTDGSVNPHDILKIKGIRAVQDYMLREVQRVYRLQGVEINDKHIEVIVRQMLKKVRIEDNGDSEFLPGTLVDALELDDINAALEAEGKQPAEGNQIMLGITKASLATNSFMSAASFQETTKVLTEAAIKGKVDPLIGLKENVIIGKLIPAGTGMKRYRDVMLDTAIADEAASVEEEIYDEELDIDDEYIDDESMEDEYIDEEADDSYTDEDPELEDNENADGE